MKPDLDRIAALVKRDLVEQFGDSYKFEPVIAERRVFYGYGDDEEEYYAVRIGFAPTRPLPDAKVVNGIVPRIRKDLWEMGLNRVSTDFIPADKLKMKMEKEKRGP